MESKLQRFKRLKATMREIDYLTRAQNRCVENCDLRRNSMEIINQKITDCDERMKLILANGPTEASKKKIRRTAPKRRVKRGDKPKVEEKPETPDVFNILDSKELFKLTEQQIEIDDTKVRIKELDSEQKKVQKRIKTKHVVLGNKTCEEYDKHQKREKEIRIGKKEFQSNMLLILLWMAAIVASIVLAVNSYTNEPYDWTCDDGEQTIKVNLVLDDIYHCMDGSDEATSGIFEDDTSAESAEMEWERKNGLISAYLIICGIPVFGVMITMLFSHLKPSSEYYGQIVSDKLKAEKDAHADVFTLHKQAVSKSKHLTKDKKKAVEDLRERESRKSKSIIQISKIKQNRQELVSKYSIQRDELSSCLELLESTELKIKEKYDSISDLLPNQI